MNVTRNEVIFDGLNIWFNENAIANVLSYGLLAEYGLVAGDSKRHSSMFYHCKASGWMEFEKIGCGLCDFDATNPKTSKT